MVGFPNKPWVFLLKMSILGWRLGVPPFKETPIYLWEAKHEYTLFSDDFLGKKDPKLQIFNDDLLEKRTNSTFPICSERAWSLASSTYWESNLFFFPWTNFPPKFIWKPMEPFNKNQRIVDENIIFFVCFRPEVTWNAAFGQIPSQASALKQRYALLQHSAR